MSEVLGGQGQFDQERAKAQCEEIITMYDKWLRRFRVLTWVALAVCLLIEVGAAAVFFYTGNVKWMICCAVVFLGAGQLELLAKLFYWVINTKLKIMKELKQIQLQLASLGHEAPNERGP